MEKVTLSPPIQNVGLFGTYYTCVCPYTRWSEVTTTDYMLFYGFFYALMCAGKHTISIIILQGKNDQKQRNF